MKKFIPGLVALTVLAASVPAMAEVYVYGTIDKDKNVTVNETVTIDKTISVDATAYLPKLDSAAESATVVNSVVSGNTASEIKVPEPEAKIDGAFNTTDGIVNVNQSPGSLNNQGNAVAFSVGNTVNAAGAAATGITNAQASEESVNGFGGIDTSANNLSISDSDLKNTITGAAFNGITGITGINQSAGYMNNQHNSAAVSVGNGLVALSESDLGQFNTGNTLSEVNVAKNDVIDAGSFTGVSGIVGVNQSSGNMNNQSNVVSLAVVNF